MKIPASLLALAALAGIASADVPKKAPLVSYSLLWTRSPFTTKPPPPTTDAAPSPFEDWALGGLSQIEGGYMVTLINLKKQGEKQIIRPDRVELISLDGLKVEKPGEKGNFSVVRVDSGPNSWKDTKVILSAGGKTGSVEFKDELLLPKASAPPPAVPAAQPNGQPVPPQPQVTQPAPNNGGVPAGRQPRPRSVPTPSGSGGRR